MLAARKGVTQEPGEDEAAATKTLTENLIAILLHPLAKKALRESTQRKPRSCASMAEMPRSPA
jgi:hypothetical protein